MKNITITASLIISFSSLASFQGFQGSVSGSAKKEVCFLQTDLTEHKTEIDFFVEQRRSYGGAETIENPRQYGDDKISLVIAKGPKEQSQILKRPKYQPAEPTSAIDREFLASPGSVFVNHYLKAENITYVSRKGPREYSLQINLRHLTPTSYEYKGTSKNNSFNCVNLKPLVK